MSKETMSWLNRNVLVGDTDIRGYVWHHDETLQGAESNHYPGAIPVGDVTRRLFDWQAVSFPAWMEVPATEDEYEDARASGDPVRVFTELVDPDDPNKGAVKRYSRLMERPTRKFVTATDDYDADFNVPRQSWQAHDYNEWLVEKVSQLVHGDVHISAAALLNERKRAFVELSISEAQTVAGFEFRPRVLAWTSLDGTLATGYGKSISASVCDNTFNIAKANATGIVKVKHSKYGKLNVATARETLGLIASAGDEFTAYVNSLVSVPVSGKQWNDFLKQAVPLKVDEKTGEPLSKAAQTKHDRKVNELNDLWAHSPMVAPWKGTAFGVVQAANTWQHHMKGVNKGTVRMERNMIESIDGTLSDAESDTLKTLQAVGIL